MVPKVAIIVAKAEDNGIGCSDGLPWHMPEELKYFKEKTIGKPVIMGRKTFLSLGKPLKDRDNIVLTRGDFTHEGVFIEHSLESAIQFALEKAKEKNQDEIMIIGGEDIFKQAIKWADVVYLTQIKHEKFAKTTNAFLSESYLDGWEVVSQEAKWLHENLLDADIECDFQVLERIA